MKITWRGHACFEISGIEGTIVIDPYADRSVPGYAPLSLFADKVLCSNQRKDHHATETVWITGRETNYQIARLETYDGNTQEDGRGTNTIHIISSGSIKVAHFGSLGYDLSESQYQELLGLDVALIPVDGFETINAQQAFHMITRLKPMVVIPMHYRFGPYGYPQSDSLDKFLQLCPEAIESQENCIEVWEEHINKTIVLRYRAGA